MASWRERHSQAFRDTRHALLVETGERLVITIVLAILAIGLLWLAGGHEMAMSEVILRAATTAAILLVFPIVYTWKVVSLSSTGEWVRRRLNLWLVTAGIGALIMLCAFGGYAWDRSRGPIIWTWSAWWLGWTKSADSPLKIIGFQIPGHNRWDDPINIEKAYIRSDLNGEEIHLTLRIRRQQEYVIASTPVIPAESDFVLSGNIKQDANITVAEFRERFGRFTFIFNSAIVKRFYNAGVDEYLARCEVAASK
jgi:hypothetical protein